MTLRLVANTQDQLGEGPVWAAAEQRLYWFDIKGRRLNWLLASGETRRLDLPLRASAAAPLIGGGLLVATEGGLARIHPDAGAFRIVRPITLEPGFRTNDGKVDPQGRFWWSTMDDHHGERPGALFRTDPDGTTRTMFEGLHIANTVSMTGDGRMFYLADSRLGTIFAHPTNDFAARTPFATPEIGAPDGGAIDAQGYLWNAQWGASRIVRYAPDGRLDRIVETPVKQPTSLAFGGPGLATLYVTSAWDGLDRADDPQAGALFAFEPGVTGLPLPAFDGAAFT